MHKVPMIVSIPEEEWETFKESIKEAGSIQFKYRNATIFAEKILRKKRNIDGES